MPEFTGGKLKLKGAGVLPGKSKKKKKTGSKIKQVDDAKLEVEVEPHGGKGDVVDEKTVVRAKDTDTRTEAEKRFEAHAEKYEMQRVKKLAAKSHREKIKELNEKLATMTEHQDIPRVSYSYM